MLCGIVVYMMSAHVKKQLNVFGMMHLKYWRQTDTSLIIFGLNTECWRSGTEYLFRKLGTDDMSNDSLLIWPIII